MDMTGVVELITEEIADEFGTRDNNFYVTFLIENIKNYKFLN